MHSLLLHRVILGLKLFFSLAGFFDPGFGFGTHGDIKGSIGVLEVDVTLCVWSTGVQCVRMLYVRPAPRGRGGAETDRLRECNYEHLLVVLSLSFLIFP